VKTYFLVKGRVRHTPYMGDTHTFEDLRLVVADTAEHAKDKYEDWWEAKSSDYSDSYYASGEVMETIE